MGVRVGESRCPTALQSSELDREWQRGTGHLYLAVGMGSNPCLEAQKIAARFIRGICYSLGVVLK
jgi:hypothetical protein